jgi:tyrosine-protein kinase Etk/Wzc
MENSPLSLSNEAPAPSSSPVDDFSIDLLLYIINKSIIWIFLIVIISFSLAIIYLRYTPRIYQATTAITLKQQKNTQILGIRTPLETHDLTDINREVQLVKSNLFVERVVRNLPLQVAYFKEGKTKLISTELYTSSPFVVEVDSILDNAIFNVPIYIKMPEKGKLYLTFSIGGRDNDVSDQEVGKLISTHYFKITIRTKNPAGIDGASGEIYNFRMLDKGSVINEVANKIEVQPLDPYTKTIGLAYKDGNAEKAKEILAGVCNEFIKYDIELKSESFQNVLKFIDSQIDTFGRVFDRFQDSVTLQRIKDHYLNTGDSYINSLADKIAGFGAKSGDFEYDISLMKTLKQVLMASKEYSNLPSIKFKTAALNFDGEIAQINVLQVQRNMLLLDATPEHPQVRLLDKQIEEAKIRLNRNIDNDLAAIQEQYAQLKTEYQKYLDEIVRLPDLQSKYARLEKMAAMRNDFVNNLFSQKSNYLIAGAGVVSDYVILESPYADPNPISPNEVKIKLSGLMVGLILGLLMIVVRYLLHTTITSVDEVVKKTNAALLGVIPRYKEELQRSQVVVTQDPKSAITESFRSVRTNLQFISNTPGSKILSTTSTIPGEGKTFVSLNIAAILTLLNKKVIILDLDMRKPRLDKIFDVESHKGISTILSGQTKVDDCIMESGIPNLDFITSGPVPPNPSELILLPKLPEVLEYLKTKYDYVIIDTPPIGLVTDALEILKISDYPIYILRAAYSNRNFVQAINRTISENKIKNLSVILNDFGRGASGYGYGYGNTYGYNYGYGYSYYGSKYGEGYYTTETKKKPQSWLSRLLGEK